MAARVSDGLGLGVSSFGLTVSSSRGAVIL